VSKFHGYRFLSSCHPFGTEGEGRGRGAKGEIYGDRTKALHDINALLANPSAHQVKLLLLPTANLQELSMDCGWGSQFNNLAARLEAVLGID